MTRVAEHIGQVLVQRAAERHVDHLRAAADAQHRHAAPQRAADQRELPGVALAVGLHGLVGGRMARLAVAGRVHVPSAGDDQSVQPVEHPLGGIGGLRRQQHRGAAGEVDALHVDGRQKACVHIPDPGLRLLQIGGQAEHAGLRFSRQSRSKPRTLSQSVTAALNAVISMRALLR